MSDPEYVGKICDWCGEGFAVGDTRLKTVKKMLDDFDARHEGHAVRTVTKDEYEERFPTWYYNDRLVPDWPEIREYVAKTPGAASKLGRATKEENTDD